MIMKTEMYLGCPWGDHPPVKLSSWLSISCSLVKTSSIWNIGDRAAYSYRGDLPRRVVYCNTSPGNSVVAEMYK